MEHYEMAELLSRKAGVSLEEARAALEENEWDILDAMVALERKNGAAAQQVAVEPEPDGGAYSSPRTNPVKNTAGKGQSFFTNGFSQIWYYVKRIARMTVENDFVIIRKDRPALTFPVLVLLILLVFGFWFVVAALVIGLFIGCRYRFEGKELGREAANKAMDKIGDAVDNLKETLSKDE